MKGAEGTLVSVNDTPGRHLDPPWSSNAPLAQIRRKCSPAAEAQGLLPVLEGAAGAPLSPGERAAHSKGASCTTGADVRGGGGAGVEWSCGATPRWYHLTQLVSGASGGLAVRGWLRAAVDYAPTIRPLLSPDSGTKPPLCLARAPQVPQRAWPPLPDLLSHGNVRASQAQGAEASAAPNADSGARWLGLSFGHINCPGGGFGHTCLAFDLCKGASSSSVFMAVERTQCGMFGRHLSPRRMELLV